MKTLNQFKSDLNVETIQFMIGPKGREFATIGDVTLIVSPKLVDTEPMYVLPITKNKLGDTLENVYTLCNTSVKMGRVL